MTYNENNEYFFQWVSVDGVTPQCTTLGIMSYVRLKSYSLYVEPRMSVDNVTPQSGILGLAPGRRIPALPPPSAAHQPFHKRVINRKVQETSLSKRFFTFAKLAEVGKHCFRTTNLANG